MIWSDYCDTKSFCDLAHSLYFKIFPVGLGRSTVTISSSIIGIFHLKFFTVDNGERAYVQMEEDVEIVIGRDKVSIVLLFFSMSQFSHNWQCFCSGPSILCRPFLTTLLNLFTVNGQGDQNILVNVFFSLGMGLALLIMGIDIDLDQVMEAVR